MLLQHLPPDSATARAVGGPGWRLEHYLAAHLFQATTGEPHPGLPVVESQVDPDQAKRIAAFHKRAKERQRQIDAGEIT